MRLIQFTLITLLFSNHALCETNTARPNVVVSIRPIHSITLSLTQGILTPKLLIKDLNSPHHYTLKPSDLMLISNADLLIQVSPTLESSINKALHQMQEKSIALTLANNPKLNRLKSHQQKSSKTTLFDSTHNTNFDNHIWLNPLNMVTVAKDILDALKKIDPIHSNTYEKNFKAVKTELNTLNTWLKQKFSNVRDKHFLVGHNAYQYLESQYQLKSIGALTDHPEQPPSIKHLLFIKTLIQTQSARCLFYGPEYPKKLIRQITHDHPVRAVELDHMGYQSAAGQYQYTEMMKKLANKMIQCLQ